MHRLQLHVQFISAFGKPLMMKGEFSSIDFCDIVFTIIFSVDMCLRFLITFEDVNKKKITTFKEIAQNYIKNDLMLDMITTIPFMREISPEIKYIDKFLG